jgi:chromosomal replication initiator protein
LREHAPARGRGESSPLNPNFTFDTFVIGPSNNFAHAASVAVAQAPARAYNPLFIHGGTGLGKTHLMQAIGHHVLSTSRASVCYLSSETLLNEYINALQDRTLIQFRKKYRSVDLLLIDDIHFLAGKDRLQEEFFHTFNVLFDSHKQIVMTSDRPAGEITGLEQRLVSRFEWGLVTELQAPDLETRIAILRNKQATAAIKLPDNLLVFIAENIRSNVRRLEGALVRAISYASLTRQPLTQDALKHLLRDSLSQEKQPDITFDSIQRAVAEHYDVRITDLSSKRRPRDVAVPRQVAMFLCRKMTRSSFPEIANAFGKTHATVLHACRAVSNRMDVDAELRDHVERISQKLGRVQP